MLFMGNLQLKYVKSWENEKKLWFLFFKLDVSALIKSNRELFFLSSSSEYRIRPYFPAFMLCLLHHFLDVILSDVFWVVLALVTFAVFAAVRIAFAVLFDFRAIDILYTFGTTHFFYLIFDALHTQKGGYIISIRRL
jgi:hypothetical protein